MRAPGADPGSTGYCSSAYAHSLAYMGDIHPLRRSAGWCIQRSIPGTEGVDAMGPYPLLCCRDWQQLGEDLASLPTGTVSFSCVIDPLAVVSEQALLECFPDRLVAFKTHYVVELAQPLGQFVSKHHQRYAKRARERLNIGVLAVDNECAETWVRLYGNLVRRHDVHGFAAFPDASLRAQILVPGAVVFCATKGKDVVGMQVWLMTQGKAYYHLGAYTEAGYSERASFGLMWVALEHFQAQGVDMANLGGGAGLKAAKDDGLVRFKAGWSNAQRTAYFGGRVLDRREYGRLIRGAEAPCSDFFPAYRAP